MSTFWTAYLKSQFMHVNGFDVWQFSEIYDIDTREEITLW
jgi:hypothetical protein